MRGVVRELSNMWNCQSPVSISQSVSESVTIISARDASASENDQKVSHNMKQGQKIRAGVSPPPFSGNARKKTFFLHEGFPKFWCYLIWCHIFKSTLFCHLQWYSMIKFLCNRTNCASFRECDCPWDMVSSQWTWLEWVKKYPGYHNCESYS